MYDNCSTSTATRRDAINSTSQQRSYRRRKFGNIARPDSPKCKVNFGNFDDHDDDDDGGGDDVNAVIDWWDGTVCGMSWESAQCDTGFM